MVALGSACAVSIAYCFQVEVLAYLRGEFHSMVVDISNPVVLPTPKITGVAIEGRPVEGALLTVTGLYYGGREGPSLVTWHRVREDGEEVALDAPDPRDGYVPTREDIGCRIKARYVPAREDGVLGQPQMAVTDTVVVEGPPQCQALEVVGTFLEDRPLTAQAAYSGGEEGESRWQWLREIVDENTEVCPMALVCTVPPQLPRPRPTTTIPEDSAWKPRSQCQCQCLWAPVFVWVPVCLHLRLCPWSHPHRRRRLPVGEG